MKFSENQFAQMTGKTRATIRRKLDGLEYEDGSHRARVYDSKSALERIYGVDPGADGEFVTEAESRRLLNLKKLEEIELDMQVKRKARIPLELIEQVNDRTFSGIAGTLKANSGKVLTEDLINDLFAELREIGAALK